MTNLDTASRRPSTDRQADPALIGDRTITIAMFGRRALAWVVDGAIIGLVGIIARAALGNIVGLLVEGGVLFAYYGWLEGVAGHTVGKRVMGLRVVDREQRAATGVPRAVLRRLCWFLSAFPVGLGFVWLLVDRDTRTWHDHLAGTVVVLHGSATER